MKPKEKKPDVVYRVIERKTGQVQGVYSRAYCDEFDFESASEARNARVDGEFEDKSKYRVAKYRVIYKLLDEDVQ